METRMERGPNDKAPDLAFQEEQNFLPALITPLITPTGSQDSLAPLRSSDFSVTIVGLFAGIPMPQERMVSCLLEMFRLHKLYAATFTNDKGWIGEPYVIYKITKTGVEQIR
jgi:hypothetical protein